MTVPRGMMVALAALVIFGGLGLGAILALVSHSRTTTQTTTTVAVATTRKPAPVKAVPPAKPTAKPTVAMTIVPTTAATATPIPTATAQPTGTWRIEEANTQVGTIVWVGSAITRGSNLIFDLHKASVAGRPAVPCERETNLHIVMNVDRASQSVPYHEVNCDGGGSDGIVEVSALPSHGSFTGTFWNGATKLGDFEARQQ